MSFESWPNTDAEGIAHLAQAISSLVLRNTAADLSHSQITQRQGLPSENSLRKLIEYTHARNSFNYTKAFVNGTAEGSSPGFWGSIEESMEKLIDRYARVSTRPELRGLTKGVLGFQILFNPNSPYNDATDCVLRDTSRYGLKDIYPFLLSFSPLAENGVDYDDSKGAEIWLNPYDRKMEGYKWSNDPAIYPMFSPNNMLEVARNALECISNRR